MTKKRKKTGEGELFEKIWQERPHACTVCDAKLPIYTVKFFAHVLGKGAEPAARLDEDNIFIMCFPCHYRYDMETHRASDDPRYDFVFDRKQEIKTKYNNRNNGT